MSGIIIAAEQFTAETYERDARELSEFLGQTAVAEAVQRARPARYELLRNAELGAAAIKREFIESRILRGGPLRRDGAVCGEWKWNFDFGISVPRAKWLPRKHLQGHWVDYWAYPGDDKQVHEDAIWAIRQVVQHTIDFGDDKTRSFPGIGDDEWDDPLHPASSPDRFIAVLAEREKELSSGILDFMKPVGNMGSLRPYWLRRVFGYRYGFEDHPEPLQAYRDEA